MKQDVERWADKAMYEAVPTSFGGKPVTPSVTMISATPDPLGAMTAASLMYQGKPCRRTADVTDEQRMWFFNDIKKTRLDSPFEFIDLHFLIEGVTRAFTHQMVRQRTAVYVQESQRFAVKANGEHEVALPPSLVGTQSFAEAMADFQKVFPAGDPHAAAELLRERATESERQRWEWDRTVASIAGAYNYLVNSGIPAEDARGLLPTNITTRIHYKTNLRALLGHAGNRLCTQAQFEWRVVWGEMIKAMREYGKEQMYYAWDDQKGEELRSAAWQFDEIASMFKPICYQKGSCQFLSDMDRHCKIRDRVQANAEINRPSSEWGEPYSSDIDVMPIRAEEWLADPTAARIKAGE